MSYNIDTWKTKALEDFSLPLAALYADTRGYLVKPRLDPKTGAYRIAGMDGTVIGGTITDDRLTITAITVHGEGSGTTFFDILLPAFAQSSGTLRATLVWEGGDSITRLSVVAGVVVHDEVEL